MDPQLRLTSDRHSTALTVHVAGALDYASCDELVDFVTGRLGSAPGVREVRLNFRGLTHIDSSGLAALLAVRRRTGAASALLHLDERSTELNRMLHLTDTLEHLTSPEDETPGGAGTG